jgi:hypothetical protein
VIKSVNWWSSKITINSIYASDVYVTQLQLNWGAHSVWEWGEVIFVFKINEIMVNGICVCVCVWSEARVGEIIKVRSYSSKRLILPLPRSVSQNWDGFICVFKLYSKCLLFFFISFQNTSRPLLFPVANGPGELCKLKRDIIFTFSVCFPSIPREKKQNQTHSIQ